MSHHDRRFDPQQRHGPPPHHRLSPAIVTEHLQAADFELLPARWQHEDAYLIEAQMVAG